MRQFRTACCRSLRSPRLVGVSYGLYLFHFPIILIVRETFSGQNRWLDLVAVALAVALAVLSRRYVEAPCLRVRYVSLWPNATRYLAYLGPACVTFGSLYIAYCLW
jgi:peptidoglycan/LPS O-acetylase OafA/YrhL